jgi:magnesium transporter
MVGASPEEGLDSSLAKCIKLRGPWLLVNLITAFVAGAVVGAFQETIDQIVLLAMFLPILAGQSNKTGTQTQCYIIERYAVDGIKSSRISCYLRTMDLLQLPFVVTLVLYHIVLS